MGNGSGVNLQTLPVFMAHSYVISFARVCNVMKRLRNLARNALALIFGEGARVKSIA